MEVERVSARRRHIAGKASDYISQFNVQPGDKIVLCCRVSGHEQHRRGNLADQEANLRRAAARLGADVAGVVSEVWAGTYPVWLARAVALAQRHGAVALVAESTDRFIRSDMFSNINQNAQPRTDEFEYLRYMTDGFALMTVLHPDATPGEVRAYHSRRGQFESGRFGGRPAKREAGNKKRRREECWPLLIEMLEEGGSLRRISHDLGVPKSTVQDWIRECD